MTKSAKNYFYAVLATVLTTADKPICGPRGTHSSRRAHRATGYADHSRSRLAAGG